MLWPTTHLCLTERGGDAGAVIRNQQLFKLALLPKKRLLGGSHGDREGYIDSVPCETCRSSVRGLLSSLLEQLSCL